MADDTNTTETPRSSSGWSREDLKKAADDILKANRAKKGAASSEEAEIFEFPAEGEEAEDAAPDPMQQLLDENASLKDQLLRMAAEMENLRKRTARDVQDARAYAVTAFARDILGVADDLRRGIEMAATSGAAGEAHETVKPLLEGMELSERSMLAAMERHGVKRIEAEGQKFDPNFHQAMFEVPNPNVPNNTVVQVVQAGFAIGDRVLRPAMVGVAKGGPKAQPAADLGDQAGNSEG